MNNENRFEQIAGMAILLLLVIGCFVVLRPFVSALLLALILSIQPFPSMLGRATPQGSQGVGGDVNDVTGCLISLVPLIVLGSSLAEQIAVAIRWSAPYR